MFNAADIDHGFNYGPWTLPDNTPIHNYAKCPDCGGLMIDDGRVYTSYPPQYKFTC